MKTKLLLAGLVFISINSFSQVYKNPNAAVEDRVNDLLSNMTLAEKLDYIGGINSFYIRSIPRLGVPTIKMSDGPVGVRNYGSTTAYPAGILSASTWDTDLINKLGVALGKDARARGVHILLAPGMNIYRAPMCGRNFEYFGEDPYLSGQMAVAYIKGVQSQGVVCTAKHYACNNQEWDRNNISSDVDERTLREIYLPAFKAAVTDGKAGAVMNSYNLINSIHATQNGHLNNEILKGDWGFDGVLMSDWSSTYNGLAAANNGLDLEMPNAAFMNRATLTPYITNNTLPVSIIDDKVRRILRLIFRNGFYDRIQTDGSIPLDNPENALISQKVAEAGIVLLKNQDSILPLKINNIKNIAVIGPNADQYVAGGGSSYTTPYHFVTTVQGIKKIAGSSITVNVAGDVSNYTTAAKNSVFYTAAGSTTTGLNGEYFKNKTLTGTADFTRIDQTIDYHWPGAPNVTGFPSTNYSIRWTGVIRPTVTGTYTFLARGDDGFRLWVNNQQIINLWQDQGATQVTANVNLVAGQEYPVKLEYYQSGGLADITLGWYSSNTAYDEVIKTASAADVAIVCVGFNSNLEGEGFDRPFELPATQDSLINVVARTNPNTIVVVNAGGNVYMQNWISHVKGLLYAFYPGQEGGTALSEILFGIVNPSGKLPATFEKKWADNPVYKSYSNNGTGHIKYTEGLMMGYRGYDIKSVDPMYPFGFGLSYTSFEYSNIQITKDTIGGALHVYVQFDVKNTGRVEGAESSQIYVGADASLVSRPVKELKGFSKVNLQPGEKQNVRVELNKEAFAYFSVSKNTFVVDKGIYTISIGSSSKDIRLKDKVAINEDYILTDAASLKINENNFNIYPIPATEYVIFENSNSNQRNINVEIINSEGQSMDSFSTDELVYKYNTSKLKSGIYFCHISTKNENIVKKIIIQ
ncbi:MAG: glycoside hydrolase family 3 C-terminal domain-containing protein [Candidatus Saccharibacteria bacterium]